VQDFIERKVVSPDYSYSYKQDFVSQLTNSRYEV